MTNAATRPLAILESALRHTKCVLRDSHDVDDIRALRTEIAALTREIAARKAAA